MHFSLVSGSFARLPSWLSSSINQVKPRAELGTLKLRRALPAMVDAEWFGAPKRTMTERFAIICHGTRKQCCLVNLTLVTTGLPVASCQIYCRLLPAGIDVACTCFLEILSYFPFSFMLLQPRVSGKVRQRTHWKQKGSLTSTRTPLHSSQIPVFRMLAGAWPTHTASHAELWQDGDVRVKQTQVCWTQGGNHQTHLPFT